MQVKPTVIIWIMLMALPSRAFQQIQKDTSYTIQATYKKLVKKHPTIQAVAVAESNSLTIETDIVYEKKGKRELHLDHYKNHSGLVSPAIIMVHGGGWKSGDKKLMAPLASHLALKGYQCFAVEYRLSDEAKYPAAIHDVEAAVRFIKTHAKEYQIDPERIIILGASAGAQIATLVGCLQEKSIHAIVNIDGVVAFKHPESSEGDMAAYWLGGTYAQAKENWEAASAINHVSKKTAPILFISSSVPRFQAGRDDMIAELNEFGVYCEHRNVSDSPHCFWLFDPWFEKTLNYITSFLDQTLKKN